MVILSGKQDATLRDNVALDKGDAFDQGVALDQGSHFAVSQFTLELLTCKIFWTGLFHSTRESLIASNIFVSRWCSSMCRRNKNMMSQQW